MLSKYLFHPLVLFWAPSTFAIGMWAVTPQFLMEIAHVRVFVDIKYVFQPLFLSFALFFIGMSLARVMRISRWRFTGWSSKSIAQLQWYSSIIAVGAFGWLAITVIKDHGIQGIFNSEDVRGSYQPGLTTLVHLSTVCIVVAGVSLVVTKSWKSVCWVPFTAAVLVSAHRAFVGTERLALFIPLIAMFPAVFLVRFRRVRLKALGYLAFGVTGVAALFIFAEYFRSYSLKSELGEDIERNPVVYGLQRLALYYSLSVNAGAGSYEIFTNRDAANPLFANTLRPAAKLLYSDRNDGVERLHGIPVFKEEMLIERGYFSHEFNNSWGVATPFLEGWVVAAFFWIFWAFLGTKLYYHAVKYRSDICGLSLFGLFVAAFIDTQSRVLMLGEPHFVIPFCTILGWCFLTRVQLHGDCLSMSKTDH